eukprot:GHVL01008378.1.p1 GENE.GHVL01008378.1~~GHVL01008378.1.p1  ORF type:complete len:319 (+),score=60.47 GHVL01008378.1:87-1043(+)
MGNLYSKLSPPISEAKSETAEVQYVIRNISTTPSTVPSINSSVSEPYLHDNNEHCKLDDFAGDPSSSCKTEDGSTCEPCLSSKPDDDMASAPSSGDEGMFSDPSHKVDSDLVSTTEAKVDEEIFCDSLNRSRYYAVSRSKIDEILFCSQEDSFKAPQKQYIEEKKPQYIPTVASGGFTSEQKSYLEGIRQRMEKKKYVIPSNNLPHYKLIDELTWKSNDFKVKSRDEILLKKLHETFHQIDSRLARRRIETAKIIFGAGLIDECSFEYIPAHLSVPNLAICMKPFYEEDKRVLERLFSVDDIRSDASNCIEDLTGMAF